MLIIHKRQIRTNSAFVSLIFIIYFLIELIITQHGAQLILLRILLPLCTIYIYLSSLFESDNGSVLKFVKKYSDIITLFAVISLFLYFFGTVMNMLPSFKVDYYWAGEMKSCKTYFYLLFETQEEDFFGTVFIRNCGIFAEAPSYAVPLVMSLFIEIFPNKGIRKKRIIILLTTVLTTFSTKAIMLVCIIAALKFFEMGYVGKNTRKYRQIIQMIVSIAIIVSMYVMIIVLGQKSDSDSYISRIDNISSCLQAFRDNFLFGMGLGNESGVSAYSGLDLRWQGFSMGAPLIIAEGGIYLGLFYLASFINALYKSGNRWMVASTGVVYFGLLFTSNIIFFLSTIFILALGFAVPNQRNIK